MNSPFSPKSREIQFSRAIVASICLLIFALIVWKRPFWGPMDDHYNALEMVPIMWKEGVLRYAIWYGQSDLSWGMYRPTNPIMVFFLYSPAVLTAPWVLYVTNALVCIFLLYFSATVFERFVKAQRWLILLFTFAFFYMYDLFQHPSLQEKVVILFGTLLLWLLSSPRRGWYMHLGIVLAVAFGIMAKASFTIYLSMAVWVAFWRDPGISWGKRFLSALPLALLELFALGFFAVISRRGNYTTANYSWEKILPNVASSAGILFVSALLLAFAWFRYSWKRGEEKNPLVLTPAIGLAAFLAIFLPWGIAAYIQSVIAPAFAALAALLATRILHHRFGWVYALGALALAMGAYRSYVNFTRLGDLGTMVALSPEWEKAGVKEIYMPCSEGSGAMQRFFDKVSHANIKVLPWGAEPASVQHGRYVLYDQGLCPLPGRAAAVEGCRSEPIYAGSFAKSYRLVKLHCLH